ncbi:MAG: putative spermidine/putrescine transport system permease protein, partial [Chloroflexota bacterium]|nr:putative spermidine/putrescine transport system permease protein [Chloroflexota bacterium]
TALGGQQEQVLLPVLILSSVRDLGEFGRAGAQGVLLLTVSLLGLAVLTRLGGLSSIYGGVAARRARRPGVAARRWGALTYSPRMGATFGWLSERAAVVGFVRGAHAVLVGAILLFLAAPTIAAIPASLTSGTFLGLPPRGLSLRWYQTVLTDPTWTSAITTSLVVSIPAALLATILGFCAALTLVRGYAKARSAYMTFLLLPMLMPHVVTALGLFFVTIAVGQAFTERALVIAYTLFALPTSVIVMTASLQGFDWDLDRAAQSLGAGWSQRLRHVLVPLLRPAVLVSLLFAFLTSYTELIFALLMQTVTLTTVPVKMWTGILYGISPAIAAAAGLMVVATGAAFAVSALIRRGPRPVS